MNQQAIILVTSADGQYNITKKCLESIKIDKYNFRVYLLNYGTQDRKIKKLRRWVDRYKEFELGTPIAEEMRWGIQEGLNQAKYIFNANNDIILHPKTIDMMIDIMQDKAIYSLSGHIITSESELKRYTIDAKFNLYYDGIFISRNRFKTWLPIFKVDFGFDLYSFNAWSREFFERVGFPDTQNFNKGIYLWDSDYQYRAALAGIDSYVASSAIYYHECGHTYKNTNQKADRKLLYTQMRDTYRKKWGGPGTQSPYYGPQHNEDFVLPFQYNLSQEEIYEKLKEPKK